MPYLISISIGPVQDFIASARRSRDLWFGSWLLSELSKTAAKAIGEDNLIFPSASDDNLIPGSAFNVANKILAEVTEKPDDVEKRVEEAIGKRLSQIRDEAFNKLYSDRYFEAEIAKAQVSDLVEFFFVAVSRTENYENDRNKVDILLAARKATRNFKKVTGAGNVPKSSLDGQRESVIHEDAYGQSTEKKQKEFDAKGRPKLTKEQLRIHFGVKEGERLCGIGLLKRHGNRKSDGSFFSTSHVASLPLLARLKDESFVLEYIRELSNLLTEIDENELYKILGRVPKDLEHPFFKKYDGHLLFPERLSEFFTDKNKLQLAKEALIGVPEKDGKPRKRGVFEKAFDNKKPLPYYALLLADGDNMGKAIDKQTTKEEHQEFSAKLSKFAEEAKKIIEGEKQGSLIYAGGDDVLAFVALHKVLDYAQKLAVKFKEILARPTFDDEQSPTLSIGVAVAHHLEPLEDTLDLARKAEKAAKAVDGKNALAVILDKRSGTSRIMKGTWGTIDKRLNQFIKWHQEKESLNSAAYQLRDLANHLEVFDKISDEDRQVLQRAKFAEAKRILERKEISETALRDLEKFLDDIRDVLKKEHLTKNKGEKDFVDKSVEIFAEELIIAKILADAKNLAGEKDE